MGAIVGGLIGAGGSLLAGNAAAKEAYKGFDYLKGSPVGQTYLPNGGRANQQIADLLGVGGDPTAANNAFQKYNDSTGLNFQLQEGQKAVTTSNASRGLLNSGATLKALTSYGQNLGKSAFSNYLTQLGGLSSQGLTAGGAIGEAGTTAGSNAAQSKGTGIGNAFGLISGLF